MIDEIEITIWGRTFLLPVEYEVFEDDTITDKQIEAFAFFKEHLEWINKSKQNIELYCKERVMSDNKNDKKDNIFSYVMPDYFFVEQNDKEPSVALMLNYRYDPEHGIAVVFMLNGEIKVGNQDIIL